MDGDRSSDVTPNPSEPVTPMEAISRFTGLTPEAWVPVEVQAERSRRWATRTLVFATLFLALCNARAIRSWASTLPPDWGGVTARALSQVWGERMAAAGLDRPRSATQAGYDAAKGLTWRQVAGTRVEVVKPK